LGFAGQKKHLIPDGNSSQCSSTHVAVRFLSLIVNGSHDIAKPHLVIRGEAYPMLQYFVATAAVEDMDTRVPASPVEFIHMLGVTHDPVLTASQRQWTDWITGRFASKDAASSYTEWQIRDVRPIEALSSCTERYISIACQSYHTG
jgi:hypothetical protein